MEMMERRLLSPIHLPGKQEVSYHHGRLVWGQLRGQCDAGCGCTGGGFCGHALQARLTTLASKALGSPGMCPTLVRTSDQALAPPCPLAFACAPTLPLCLALDEGPLPQLGGHFRAQAPTLAGSVHTRHKRWADQVAGTAVHPSICCCRLGADGLPDEGVLHAQMPAICRGLLSGDASIPCQTDPGHVGYTSAPCSKTVAPGKAGAMLCVKRPDGTGRGGRGDRAPTGRARIGLLPDLGVPGYHLQGCFGAVAGHSPRQRPRASPAGPPSAWRPETRGDGKTHTAQAGSLDSSVPAASTGRKPAKPNTRETPPESRLSAAPPIAALLPALPWQPRPASAFPEPARRRLCARALAPAFPPLPRGAPLCRGRSAAVRSSWGVWGRWKRGRRKPNQSLLTPAPARRPGGGEATAALPELLSPAARLLTEMRAAPGRPFSLVSSLTSLPALA
uniref:uncharacterized protein LOC114673015 n=1 Tax=Macaca mulatta TaxID=9544 RepID=UPI0010A24788|nr:uncharacterized protein LOC114673015 [Macaca mulatta]